MSGDHQILAHGIGGAKDLPISPALAIAGAVAALTISFTVLVLAWRDPRYDAATSGRPAPATLAALVDSRAFALSLRVLGMVVFLYAVWAAVLGEDLLINPFFGMVYVLLWVGLVPASLLLGPVLKACSPVRTINLGLARLTGSDPDRGLFPYPARLGYWPAAGGLFAFVWLELVYHQSTALGPVRLWFAVYLAVMLLGGALFGSGFYERADPFEVYSSLVAKLSVWGRRDGALVVRSPLANLDTVVVRPGLLGVVAVLFGSTAFDSFKDSSVWVRFTQGHLDVAYLLNNVESAGLLRGRLGDLRRRVHGHRRGSRAEPLAAAQPLRALGRADHRRLHHRPLPELPRRGRPADGDLDERPDVQRQQPARHR